MAVSAPILDHLRTYIALKLVIDKVPCLTLRCPRITKLLKAQPPTTPGTLILVVLATWGSLPEDLVAVM